jgi:hypothetical protein
MSRRIVTTLIAASVAAAGVVVVGTVAWSNIAAPVGGQAYVNKFEFNQAFADAAAGGSVAVSPNGLRQVGSKLVNGQRLMQSFWVAAVASPYLRPTSPEMLQPLSHMPRLHPGKFGQEIPDEIFGGQFSVN